MTKKNDIEKAFEEYRKGYLGKFFKQDLKLLLKKHREEIAKFREEWWLDKVKIKTQKDYDDWLRLIEKPLARKKRKIVYLEEEEGHILKGFETVGIEFFTLAEEWPRFIIQGDSLEVVFDYELRKLMRKSEIDPDLWPVFRHYILTRKILLTTVSHPNIEVTERFLFGPDKDELDHKISLNFGPNTRLREIKKVWQFIVEPLQEKMKALLKGKTRTKPTMKIGLKMLNLHKQGKTVPQILEVIDPDGRKWNEIKARKAIARARKWVEK